VITDAAIEAALAVSDHRLEYVGRKQPDKSIDLLDEACALYRLRDQRELPEAVRELKAERGRLIGVEREAIDALLSLANARGNLLERFSIGTYKALEAMGLGLERLLTGGTTPRPPVPRPDSVRRMEEADPAARLAAAHQDRLLIEDRLHDALEAAGAIVDREQVETAHGQNTGTARNEP
jgi:ATP-dependent Clp protease ATP-binding subunit ClpA